MEIGRFDVNVEEEEQRQKAGGLRAIFYICLIDMWRSVWHDGQGHSRNLTPLDLDCPDRSHIW